MDVATAHVESGSIESGYVELFRHRTDRTEDPECRLFDSHGIVAIGAEMCIEA
jgi:hypothetical protein